MKIEITMDQQALSRTETTQQDPKRLAEQKFLSEVVEAIEARRKLLKPTVYRKPKVKVG